MRTLDDLHENLVILQKYLAPPEPRPTINVEDLRPLIPKDEEEVKALAKHRETHARM
jgi:hypothetical protein